MFLRHAESQAKTYVYAGKNMKQEEEEDELSGKLYLSVTSLSKQGWKENGREASTEHQEAPVESLNGATSGKFPALL